MRKSWLSEEQTISILQGAGSGQLMADFCRKHEISSGTFYKWKSSFVSMDVASQVSTRL